MEAAQRLGVGDVVVGEGEDGALLAVADAVGGGGTGAVPAAADHAWGGHVAVVWAHVALVGAAAMKGPL